MQTFLFLFVTAAPKAVILGGPEFHVDVGSHVNLTCVVQNSPEPPEYIFWHHQDQVSRESNKKSMPNLQSSFFFPLSPLCKLLHSRSHIKIISSEAYSWLRQGPKESRVSSSVISPFLPNFCTRKIFIVVLL